jgi:hypothetical protein
VDAEKERVFNVDFSRETDKVFECIHLSQTTGQFSSDVVFCFILIDMMNVVKLGVALCKPPFI